MQILFNVYKYVVLLGKDGKEGRHLELVQKRTMISKFDCLVYIPALGQGCYHSTSYMLATQCQREQQVIMCRSVSSHPEYGSRMSFSFIEEIQSGFYQNTSMSVEGALLEWVNMDGVRHTQYFGYWLDDSKQDAAATTRNMCSELCIEGNVMQLVERLAVGGTVWKGMDGTAVLY
jgi:hypothetical protein